MEKTKIKQSKAPVAKVYDITGAEKKSIALDEAIFNAPVNQALIAQSVRVYMNNQRSGNASTKTRSEVKGSTRKIYRQKGTGKARHGDIKAPIFVGGGVVGGPRPKNYSLSMGNAMKSKALFGALTSKVKDQEIVGLEEAGLDKTNKTKTAYQFLKKVGFDGQRVTFVFPKIVDSSFMKALRNIENLQVTDAMSLNPYLVLKSKRLIFLETAFDVLKKHYKV
jgi:large subunit ribosomal protein L4